MAPFHFGVFDKRYNPSVERLRLDQPYLGATPDPASATREAMQAAKDGLIPLVEIFYSLQGEGLRSGRATVFIRTAGCNCDCWFCDTDFRVRFTSSAQEIVSEARRIGGDCRWVCLTGGEPTILDLGPLCDLLREQGFRIQMETNGSLPRPAWRVDHITVSPKTRQGARLDPWYLQHAAEFKYVIDSERDLEDALAGVHEHGKPTSLQPNALNPEAARLCVEAVKSHPQKLRLSLQTHKYLQIP
jgi:organic radical activating enzyme